MKPHRLLALSRLAKSMSGSLESAFNVLSKSGDEALAMQHLQETARKLIEFGTEIAEMLPDEKAEIINERVIYVDFSRRKEEDEDGYGHGV